MDIMIMPEPEPLRTERPFLETCFPSSLEKASGDDPPDGRRMPYLEPTISIATWTSDQRYLRGICSLAFEGQRFVPEDARREYWLDLSNEMHRTMTDQLRSLGWSGEWEEFGAEFEGTLTWEGHGFGHLGVFGGKATVQRVVALHFTPQPAETRDAAKPVGIRELIRRSRA